MHAAVYTCTERVCYTARLEFRSGKQETSIEGRGSQSLSLPTQEKDHLPRDTSLVRTFLASVMEGADRRCAEHWEVMQRANTESTQHSRTMSQLAEALAYQLHRLQEGV